MTTTPQSVVGILKSCLQSNTAADWEAFISATRKGIAAAVGSTLGQWISPGFDLIEDLTQDVYLVLCADNFAALRSIRAEHPEAVIRYLKVVAGSVAVDYLRSNGAQKRGDGRPVEPLEAIEKSMLASRGSSPDRHTFFLDVEKCLRLRDSVEARDRWIFWLYYRHGLTAKAIAAIRAMDLSQKGVESVLQRLTKQVRECMGMRKQTLVKVQAEGKND